MNKSAQKSTQEGEQGEVKVKSLLLPRGYLSWSALDLFEKSEKDFINKYFYGEDNNRGNDFMTFGKEFALAKETGDCKGDEMLQFAVDSTPKLDSPEEKIYADLKTPYGAIRVLAIPDDFSERLGRVLEFKTGKTVWTKARVQKHGQLKFYSVAILEKYGINPEIELWWIQTLFAGDKVRPTGKIEKFQYQATPYDIKQMRDRIIKACLRIDKLYRIHLKQPQL